MDIWHFLFAEYIVEQEEWDKRFGLVCEMVNSSSSFNLMQFKKVNLLCKIKIKWQLMTVYIYIGIIYKSIYLRGQTKYINDLPLKTENLQYIDDCYKNIFHPNRL